MQAGIAGQFAGRVMAGRSRLGYPKPQKCCKRGPPAGSALSTSSVVLTTSPLFEFGGRMSWVRDVHQSKKISYTELDVPMGHVPVGYKLIR